jgi:hypothetical protein
MSEDIHVVLQSIETAIANLDSTVHPQIYKALRRAWNQTYAAWKEKGKTLVEVFGNENQQ